MESDHKIAMFLGLVKLRDGRQTELWPDHEEIENLNYKTDWNKLMKVLQKFSISPPILTDRICELFDKINECIWQNNIGQCYEYVVKAIDEYESQSEVEEEIDE